MKPRTASASGDSSRTIFAEGEAPGISLERHWPMPSQDFAPSLAKEKMLSNSVVLSSLSFSGRIFGRLAYFL